MEKKTRESGFALRLNSLRLRLLAVVVFAILVGTTAGLTTHMIVSDWLEYEYYSEEHVKERHDEYIRNLQSFVSKNELSSDDTDQVFNWINRNTMSYIFLYKDGKLFLDNLDPPKNGEEEEDKSDKEDKGDKGDVGDEGEGERDDAESLIPEIPKPSREEMLEHAERLGLLPMEFEDGTLLVSLYDNSEPYFKNIAIVGSILIGFLLFVLILMIYFGTITSKMHRLAHDVSLVYQSDMNHRIRTDKGADELSVLGRTVEKMRVSMLDSIEKKNEALNANTELITSLSHDVRTPLTVLLGYIDIMKESTEDEATLEYILAAESTAIRLKELSDDMFRYFLVLGTYDRSEIAEYHADTVIRQMVSEHIFLLQEKKYDVTFDISVDSEYGISIDPSGLTRIFENLFSNVYKYADREKPINMSVTQEGETIYAVIENYVAEQAGDAESNRIGIKTINKLCEIMDMKFEYGVRAADCGDVFFAKLVIPAGRLNK